MNLEDRILKWQGQSFVEEEENYVDLLGEAEQELRRLREGAKAAVDRMDNFDQDAETFIDAAEEAKTILEDLVSGKAKTVCKPITPFDTAKFYDSDDCEELRHTEVEEAIEDALDSAWDKGKTPDQVLEEITPLTITAFNPKEVDPEIAGNRAQAVLDDFDESMWHDYGDQIGHNKLWTESALTSIKTKLEAGFKLALELMSVWQCEAVGSRTYTAEEIREIVPGWFERD